MNPYTLPGVGFNFDSAIKTICDCYGIHINDLKSKTRIATVREARQVCFFLGNTVNKMKTIELGGMFGFDHATIIHARKVVRNNYQYNSQFRSKIDCIFLKLDLDPKQYIYGEVE